MGTCNAQKQPSLLSAGSHLPRNTALKTTDVTSKKITPDVQLITGLHLLEELQTHMRATAVCAKVCACVRACTHRHMDTQTEGRTDTSDTGTQRQRDTRTQGRSDTETHGHRDAGTRAQGHTDTGTHGPTPGGGRAALQGAAGGGSQLLRRLPRLCPLEDFPIFSRSETLQAISS